MFYIERFKQLKKQYGKSNRALASELNVSPSSITLWESGKRNPELKNIIKMSEIFNCPISYLTDETDSKKIFFNSNLQTHYSKDELISLLNSLDSQKSQITYELNNTKNESRETKEFVKLKRNVSKDQGLLFALENDIIRLEAQERNLQNKLSSIQKEINEITIAIQNYESLQEKTNQLINNIYCLINQINSDNNEISFIFSHKGEFQLFVLAYFEIIDLNKFSVNESNFETVSLLFDLFEKFLKKHKMEIYENN